MKKRKPNFQKIFCFISFIFLATCVLWYGGRFIYFYLDNNEISLSKSDTLLLKTIKKDNSKKETFKSINEDYYFYKDPDNNYVTYSNITWRILKITENDEIVLVTDTPITNLAYGKIDTFDKSLIKEWLNKTNENNTGILENNLSNTSLLSLTKTCTDNIKDIEDYSCYNKTESNIGLLSLYDYINAGATESYINNGYYTYLSNTNEDEIWYITSAGKVNTNDGTDIYGIKPIITLSSDTLLINGTGTKTDPYIIEETNSLLASYVKLDNDIWRVYDINEDNIKLVLNDLLKVDNELLTYKYSNNNYYHNDTKEDTLAYYLNNTYLNTLSYKDKINTDNWSNYYYSKDLNYDYKKVLENKIDTKVSNLSIGNIIINNTLENYFTNTGVSKSSNRIITINKDGSTSQKLVTSKLNIRPCISIKKSLLTKGSGTESDPYEME